MNAFDVISAFLNSIFNVLASVYLFSISSEGSFSAWRYGMFLFSATGLLCMSELYVTGGFLSVLIPLTVIFSLSFVYKIKWFNRLLFACFAYVLAGLADCITEILVAYIFNIQLGTTYIKSLIIMGIVWSKALLFVFMIIIKILKYSIFNSLKHVTSYVVIVAPISLLIMLTLKYRISLWQIATFSEIFFVSLILNVVVILSAVVILNMSAELRGKAEEEAKLALLEKLLERQGEQYRDMEKHGMDLLKIKHDQKNFLYGILSDLDCGNLSDIRSCILCELNTVENTEIPTDPGSNLIYHLVWNKTDLAKSKGICIDSEYHDIKEIRVSPIDFAVILGNALDNAIEASEMVEESKERKITLMIKVHRDQIVVIIKNPVVGNIDVGNLRSTKKASGHGFGILSMKNIVSRWNGEVSFAVENGIFTTYIVMQNCE
ncbi:MAG: GHKL domain-containing protein [Clostridia bacterium]|nr:GHKL domain-containing protein [Clostridia bacterium]